MPSAPLFLHGLDFVRQLDIRGEDDVAAIDRGGGRLAQLGELFLDLRFLDLELAVFPERLVGRVDDEIAVVAIEQHVVAAMSVSLTSCRPTTAGMLMERAMMAVCEVLLPTSVAKPSTSARFSWAVSDGVRLCATRTCGVSMAESGLRRLCPSGCARRAARRRGYPARARAGRDRRFR